MCRCGGTVPVVCLLCGRSSLWGLPFNDVHGRSTVKPPVVLSTMSVTVRKNCPVVPIDFIRRKYWLYRGDIELWLYLLMRKGPRGVWKRLGPPSGRTRCHDGGARGTGPGRGSTATTLRITCGSPSGLRGASCSPRRWRTRDRSGSRDASQPLSPSAGVGANRLRPTSEAGIFPVSSASPTGSSRQSCPSSSPSGASSPIRS